MSDSNKHAGFSFQISETPPPTRASGETPLADLILDMGDFGPARDPSPPLPRQASQERSSRVQRPVPLDAARTIEASNEIRASGPLGAPRPAALETPPKADSAKVPAIPAAPQIKKISFPVAKHKSPATKTREGRTPDLKARESRAHEEVRSSSRTKFSRSISAKDPRPAFDSEPEVEPPQAAEAQQVTMAPPEDLPGLEQDFIAEDDAPTWSTDTPNAREIWKKARTSWLAASRQAASLSGQGLRASKALADAVHGKVKEHLREASDERASRAHLKSESEGTVSRTEAVPSTAPISSGSTPSVAALPTEQPRGPSMAGRAILGLARSAGRKVAAPASAVAAAALVYLIGSHFLGEGPSAALSRAAKSPEVPELGTLNAAEKPGSSKDLGEKGSGNSRISGGKAANTEKASPSGPPPMETELAEMPKGMSWPGKGLIEVVTSRDELVYVDGVFTGRGPLRRIPVSPGEHEVSIRADGKERKGSVEVLADKNTRAVFKGE